MATYGVVSSITRFGKLEPFDLQVARGQVAGHSTVNIYGVQGASTGGTSYYPAWEVIGAYTYPGSAVVMTVASASGATDAGVKVQIQGLGAGYVPLVETVTLNASGTVDTTGLFLRINAMIITSGNNAGIITAKNAGTTYAQITAGYGRTQMSIYTVPAGYTFYLQRVQAFTSFNGSDGKYAVYRNYNVSSAGVVSLTQQAPFVNAYETRRVMPRPFAEKTDIQLQGRASDATTYFISISAEGYLIANSVDAGST